MKQLDNNGFTLAEFVAVILIIGAVTYHFFIRDNTPQEPVTEVAETSQVTQTQQQSTTDIASQVTTLTPVNGYSVQGKATRQYDFPRFDFSITAALLNNFETTYYEAWLVSPNGARKNMGRLTKTSGQYRLSVTVNEDLRQYTNVVITVDGDAETVEGKSLPHDVMRGSF